jgi:hypothetical protein
MAAPGFKTAWKTVISGAPRHAPDATREELGELVRIACEGAADPNIRGHTWFVTVFGAERTVVEKRVEPSPESLQFMSRTPSGQQSCEDLETLYLMCMDFVWDEAQVVRSLKFFLPRAEVDATL